MNEPDELGNENSLTRQSSTTYHPSTLPYLLYLPFTLPNLPTLNHPPPIPTVLTMHLTTTFNRTVLSAPSTTYDQYAQLTLLTVLAMHLATPTNPAPPTTHTPALTYQPSTLPHLVPATILPNNPPTQLNSHHPALTTKRQAAKLPNYRHI